MDLWRWYWYRREDQGRDVAFTADGGAIITGYSETWGAGGRDAFLLKIDSLGVVQWMEV
jgi:hypothetical protein